MEIKYISITKINLSLKSMGFNLEDPETQIHKSIHHTRNSIKENGINLEIIETSKWKGYRLNSHILLKNF
jgi:DNA-binding response OmpR family regulator